MKKHFLLSKFLFALIVFCVAHITHATDITGKVIWVRYHTQNHPNATVAGTSAFKLNITLTSPCTSGLWVQNDDFTKAALYRAKVSGLNVGIVYDDTPSPWGDASYCRVIAFDLN